MSWFEHISKVLISVVGAVLGLGDDILSVQMDKSVEQRPSYPRTDAGNAELFAALCGKDVRYDHKRQRWLIWDAASNRWAEDKENLIRLLMKQAMRQRATLQFANLKELGRDLSWATKSENRNLIDAAIELSKSEPPISDPGTEWDTDPWLLRVANGIVDLRTGDFRHATKEDKFTKSSPISFDVAARCPRFEQFMWEIFDDEELIRFVHKAIGYSLTGSVKEQCLFACYGEGSNGKSTILELLLYILGDYAVDLPFSSLEAKQYGSSLGEGANLPGARFAKVVEIKQGGKLDEARVKSWTGGDTISIRPLYKNTYTFAPTHKLWLAFNHKPVVTDDSHAMWRRIQMIPFEKQFDGKAKDPALLEKLKAEASGILNWAIRGCLLWQLEGLEAPKVVQAATDEYRDESDEIGEFLDAYCVVGEHEAVTSRDLWAAYLGWVDQSGRKPVSRKSFAQHLARQGFTSTEGGHEKVRIWTGLRLLGGAGVRVDAGA